MIEDPHMLSVVDAIARVTDGFSLIGSEQVGLSDALGRVLAEDLNSRRDQPPVAVSSMDGYAVRTEDIANVPAYLMQVGVSRAGDGYNGVVGIGECVRIFTGAPVPEGADTVHLHQMKQFLSGVGEMFTKVGTHLHAALFQLAVHHLLQ